MATVLLPRPEREVFHPIAAACGFYVADDMLAYRGKRLARAMPANTKEALKSPAFPNILVNMLKEAGEDAEIVRAPKPEDRRKLFNKELVEKARPFAVMVGVRKLGILNATPHWYVVCGVRERHIFVYDPREKWGGPSSVREGCDAGNRKIPLKEFDDEWWGIRWVPRLSLFRDPTTDKIPHASEMRYLAVVFK